MKLRVVPARTGAQWVREGLRMFFKQPLAFAGLFFVFMAFSQVVGWLPLVGDFIGLALVPAFTVGMMAASRAVEAGQFPMPSLLISAFRASPAKTRAMLLLGAAYAAAVMLIVVFTSLASDGKLNELLAAQGGQVTPETMRDPAVQEAMRASMRQWMLASVLYLPISVLFWHAPALVHWHDVPVVKSLFFSAVGVLRNLRAYLVYFMGWMMVTMVAWLALLMVAGVLGNVRIAAAGMLPVSLAIATMVMASLWPTFRDSFEADPTDNDHVARL
ncbi:hypothetical protein FVQ98_16605 [Ottowia sp. GY511]|uniref:BPSS1780 family membrane protein n=1 Tax=Ottowia flava TaxID=2675430 RepID=A0ABW4KTZ4_9BURK|nr:BPSS1780 family membrane protein [Ottowia sp. GY511]TXK23549.1 hypothetical protein FVQ98_16605 [Ottowia sp. GY511]